MTERTDWKPLARAVGVGVLAYFLAPFSRPMLGAIFFIAGLYAVVRFVKWAWQR